MQLTALDWAIIVTYFVVTLGIGLAFRRRAGRSIVEYFVSGRSLPWWIAGTSMVATSFAADTPLAVTGLVAKNGLAGNWFWWSLALGGMFTVFIYARLWRRAEVLTDVELVEMRYAGKPAAALRGIRAVYVSGLVNPIIIGWVTGAMLTVLRQSLGDSALVAGSADWVIIGVLLAVVGVYCTLSGMWGVALTDFVQFFLAMFGCIVLAVVAVRHVGGVDALQTQVAQRFGGGDQAFRFLPDFWAADAWMPLHAFLIFLCVQWWATWYPGAEPGGGGYIVQRMASCRNERDAQLATLWYQLAYYCVRPWPWLLVALVALASYPEVRQLAVDEQFAAAAGYKADVGFVWVMRDLSPPGLAGLMLVTFFAAFMSTISTQMNWGASYLVRDIYQRFLAPDADDVHLTRVSRIVSVFVLLLGAVAAYLMRDLSVDEAWKLLAALGAGTGAVFMLRWFWWRINAWSEIVAMLASLVFFLAVTNGAAWLHDGQLQRVQSGTLSEVAPWIKQLQGQELQMLIVAVLTIASWLIATFMTQPEPDETLDRFYRKVHPGGPGWHPVAARNSDVRADADLGPRLLAVVLGASLIYLTLPAIGWLIFGRWIAALVALSAAALCAGGIAWITRRLT